MNTGGSAFVRDEMRHGIAGRNGGRQLLRRDVEVKAQTLCSAHQYHGSPLPDNMRDIFVTSKLEASTLFTVSTLGETQARE